MSYVPELFASNVFTEDLARERLPKEIFRSLRETIENGKELEFETAAAVASAMKEWAIEKGATHFCHWFQPMTGITAEKHNSFIAPHTGGRAIMEFSGKELIKGESDASSFPSGGLRATFEARGYTAWDPTSNCFVKDGTLYIPTAFCSYSGEALDKKTPLLRSIAAIDRAAMRVLRLLGNQTSKHVYVTLGIEQEYFLIDKNYYLRRNDLIFSGRTLFGIRPPKDQDMENHYYGHIKERVHAFMKDVDEELWRLGVFAKTRHNEAAPAQHEIAPIYGTANIAADHNQLIMETLKKVANEHGLNCLLHEKPFDGLTGSGKHNNWGLFTDDGKNLLDPKNMSSDNPQFFLFLCAVLRAVDLHAELLRLSVATYTNDCRLGGHEAPPAIISVFMGEPLTAVLDAIEKGVPSERAERRFLEMGVSSLPKVKSDYTDRNRTSPFAFTGNRFEFRMPGSSVSMAGANIALNTAVADVLDEFADRLEKAQNFNDALNDLLRETIREHRRIIFNGNNYDADWAKEAKERGLPDLPTAVDALPYFVTEKTLSLFERQKVYTRAEVYARYDIYLQNYAKLGVIEAETMVGMVRRELLPGVMRYEGDILGNLEKKRALGLACAVEERLSALLTDGAEELDRRTAELMELREATPEGDVYEKSVYVRDRLIPAMRAVRAAADRLEAHVGESYWPLPCYGDMLFKL